MRQVSMLLAGAVCLSAILFTGCTPKYASQKEILQYVEENVPEETELIGKTEGKEHSWDFRCKNRDIVFTVATTPGSIDIDGSFFGYTGDYFIGTDYQDKVYAYYNDVLTDIMKRHQFLAEDETLFAYDKNREGLMRSYMGSSNTFEYCKEFTIVLNNATYDWDYRYADAFLDDIRKEIVQKEQETTGRFLDIQYEIYLKISDDCYQRTGGTNSNYTSSIQPDTEVKIKDTIHLTNMTYANVLPPVYHGMLIEIENKNPDK